MRNEVLRHGRIRNLHIDRNLSQREAVTLLNVRQSMCSQYETGVFNYLIDALIRLTCYYNTSVNCLLDLTDERMPYPRARNRDF